MIEDLGAKNTTRDEKCVLSAVSQFSDMKAHGVVWRCITHDIYFKGGYSMPKKCDPKKEVKNERF